MNDKFLARLVLLLFIILLITSAFTGGYFLNSYMSKRPLSLFQSVNTKPNSFFTSQLATVQGKITAIDGKNLQIENVNGTSAKLPVGVSFLIYKFPSDGSLATPSANLDELEIDREATIGLSALGDDFEVTSVNYYSVPSQPAGPINTASGSGNVSSNNP